jgi:ketosteroid isomerase-like protein
MKIDPLADFCAMLHNALKGAVDPGAATFPDIMAEDGVMEFPFVFPGGVARLEGREKLQNYLGALAESVKYESVSKPTVHRSQEEGVFILEFSTTGRGLESNRPFEQTYISVIRVQDGHIAHYRDYWNPLVALETMGSRP